MGDEEDRKVYVGSLSWDTTDESLREYFASVGSVEEAKVVYDRETGRSRGFAFVTFQNPECAEEAIEKLNGTELDGRQIKVSKANSRGGGRGRGRGGGRGSGGGGGSYGGGGGYGGSSYGGGGGYGASSYGGDGGYGAGRYGGGGGYGY